MKYRPIVKEVEAELYREGLEDGFACRNDGCGLFDTKCSECNWNTNTPYINICEASMNCSRKVWVDKRCYIITHEDGSREVMTEKDFKATYEIVG